MTTTSPDAGTVLAQSHGAVTVLTLSYAARRNALSMPLRAALHTQLEQAMADPECRAVVLTGEGGHFCSGGDISSFGGVTPASGRARMQRVHAIVRLLVRGEKPVIAAVEGHAAGAGLCIAAACDVVVASREAKLSACFSRTLSPLSSPSGLVHNGKGARLCLWPLGSGRPLRSVNT